MVQQNENEENKIEEQNNEEQGVENINENKQKLQKVKRNNSFSIIQESNIIHGERLRTRNPSSSQNIQLQKNPSIQQTQGKSDSKSQNKAQQSENGDLDQLELLEIRKKQVSKSLGQSDQYMSKTPDLIIQIVDDIIKEQFVGKKIDEIPNLAKHGERKKKEDTTIKDTKGNIITIYFQDKLNLKKAEDQKLQEQILVKQLEQEKIKERLQQQQQKQIDFEKDQLKMDEYSKDQFSNMTPSKDIYLNNDNKRTPQKLLTEDIVLDDHHETPPQIQNTTDDGGDFVIEESNNHQDNALNNLINDELLRQLDVDDQYQNSNIHIQENFGNINQHFDPNQMNIPQSIMTTHPISDLNNNGMMDQIQTFTNNIAEQTEEINSNDKQQQIDSLIREQYLSELSQETLNIINFTNIISLDRIRDRAIDNVYFSFEDLDKDFKKLFIQALYKRCNSKESINYICNMIENYNLVIQRRAAKTKTVQTKYADLQKLFKLDLDNKFQVKTWPFIPSSHRTYECITEYSPEPPSNKESIFETLRSEKQPVQCSDECVCMNLHTLGNFSLEHGSWNSECPNRRERIECSHHDCKNSQTKHNRQKVLGVDVKETLCWGIDQYTKKNIFYILPENEREDVKFRFIQCSLLKAANLLENDGWEMKKVCDFIIRNSESKKSRINCDETKHKIKYIFSSIDRKFAKILIKAIELKADPEAFRIHPKGMGVICLNRNGIEQNDLIIEYIGEIYRPYRWFERQDFIKKYMKDNNQQDVLPDFYNIMLELHKNEGKGIDILYVDPMQKGNYSSRLSHSCDPNCGTVAIISNGSYNISMFAMKGIEYGEELAFDYSAVTESKNEHKQSTCLCGTKKCRGKYIELSNNNQKEYNYVLEKIHCFLKRNSDLVRSGSEPLTEEDLQLLEKYNLKQNIQKGCEKWLLKWISITLKSVGEEQELFFSDQLVSNKFIQHNDKEIQTLLKAIEIKEKGGFTALETEEKAKAEEKLKQELIARAQEKVESDAEQKSKSEEDEKFANDIKQVSQAELQNQVKEESMKNEQEKMEEEDIKEEQDNLDIKCKDADIIIKGNEKQEEKIEEEMIENVKKIEEKIEEEVDETKKQDLINKSENDNKLIKEELSKQQNEQEQNIEDSDIEEAENDDEENDSEEGKKEVKEVIEEEENDEQKDLTKKQESQNIEDGEEINENENAESQKNIKDGAENPNSKDGNQTRIKSSSISQKKKNNKKQKPKKLIKPKLTQEQIEKLEEELKLRDLVEKNTIEVLRQLLDDKQKEKQRNVEYIKYLSNAKVENRIQNLIISLDKVKFYLNNVKDIAPPLSYLPEEEVFINLWGKINKFQKKKKVEKQSLSIAEELIDLIKYYSHYKECQYAQKFVELFDPFMTKYVQESYDKALLAWRLFCLNIHYVFNDIQDPQFHAGALLIILYFYAFTHTYFTPHEYQPLNSEKMTISDTEMFNLELLDEDKKNGKKINKKKHYEEQRSYSSQFIWGQLTVWFKQTVASPQATLSQDRRGTLSYPQLNQSFKTNVLTYPFQEKNDKTGRSTFLNHMKEKPKDMWPPEQAKWSFKNGLKNYGTLLFEGVHNQSKIDNLIERVINIIDNPFEDKMKLFIEVESKISESTEEEIQKIQQECFDVIKQQLQEMKFQTIEKTMEQLKQDQFLIQQQSNLVDPDSKMQLRTERKKKRDLEDEDYFYGDILKKKQQQLNNQLNKQDQSLSQTKIAEEKKEIESKTKSNDEKQTIPNQNSALQTIDEYSQSQEQKNQQQCDSQSFQNTEQLQKLQNNTEQRQGIQAETKELLPHSESKKESIVDQKKGTMQLRTERKKRDLDNEDFYYGDILKMKSQSSNLEKNTQKTLDSFIQNKSKSNEEKKKQHEPASELKKRKFNEFILNSEEQSYFEKEQDIEEILKNEKNLNKYLVIDINKQFIQSQLPKIAIKMKKEYPHLLSQKTKKQSKEVEKKITNTQNSQSNDKKKKTIEKQEVNEKSQKPKPQQVQKQNEQKNQNKKEIQQPISQIQNIQQQQPQPENQQPQDNQ